MLAGPGAVIDMVATSEVSVSATSHDEAAIRAAADDLQRFGEVDIKSDMALLAVVGRKIHHTAGIGARVMAAIADAGVNIEMHSFGMRSNNISVVVKDSAIGKAVPALHAALFD